MDRSKKGKEKDGWKEGGEIGGVSERIRKEFTRKEGKGGREGRKEEGQEGGEMEEWKGRRTKGVFI
jgi:hypothetical protein